MLPLYWHKRVHWRGLTTIWYIAWPHPLDGGEL